MAIAVMILLVGTAGSLWAWHSTVQRLQAEADAEFDRFASSTFTNVEERVAHQIDLLAGFHALFRSSENVSRAEFHRMFVDLRVSSRFPGVQAIQFSRLVEDRQRPAFEAEVRRDTSLVEGGYPDYAIHPAGRRPQYVAVVYNEPMVGNEAAFGHDNAYEITRREVLERARDSGQPQTSAPIKLLQGRPGYVIRVPVYQRRSALDTVEARRQAYTGQISGVFLADDLLREVTQAQAQAATLFQVRIRDGGLVEQAPTAALPSTTTVALARPPSLKAGQLSSAPQDQRHHTIDAGGRIWTIEVERATSDPAELHMPLVLLGTGLALSLWMSLFTARLSRLYVRSAGMAKTLSAEAEATVKRMDAVLNSTADGIVTFGEDGRIVGVNRAAEGLFGLERQQVLGRHVTTVLPLGEGEEVALNLAAPPPELLGQRREVQALRADGNRFAVELTLTEISVDGERHFVGTVRDLTEAKAADEAIAMTMNELQEATDLRETMFRHAAFAILMTDAQGLIQTLNPAAERLLGRDSDSVLRSLCFQHCLDSAEFEALAASVSSALGVEVSADASFFAVALNGQDSVEHELHLRRGDGGRVPVSLTVSALRGEGGTVSGFLFIAYDVTERRQLAEQMAKLAYSDGLTGLPNRMQLERELNHALGGARQRDQALALLFIDLDRFKPINDTHGHAVGDLVLREVAKRLRSALRTSDVAARLGGDEFVVLLSQLKHISDCAAVAEKLIESLSQPMRFDDLELSVGASIGVVTYPEGGTDADTLLKGADAAMYAAKQAGRNTFRMVAAGGDVSAG